METRTVRINGTRYTIPAGEMGRPGAGGTCRGVCYAIEPAWPDGAGGCLACTIAAHGPDVAHIAHGETSILAIWTDHPDDGD
jgi:hypothetical protein